ncbi:MAG: hypothetical protein IPJ14_07525 [Kineosporiaceae bacterium]|nr:hypothetical protein [Kineosporiaceae bacterium]MBK8078418.1 hypothetical protein [Kineosporiaceae bacterium]
MFDTVLGLPLHPLVVHAVVILLPLAAVLTVAVAAIPGWRRLAPYLAVLNGAVVVAAITAVQSGESLERRVEQLSRPAELHDHAEWGEKLVPLAIALFLGALVIWYTRTRPTLAKVVAGLALVGAVGTIALTAYVGHSGATMVWKDIIANTKAIGEGGEAVAK